MVGDTGFRRALGFYISLLLLVAISMAIYFYSSTIVNVLGGAPGLAGFFLLSFVSCLSIAPIPYVVIVFRAARLLDPLPISVVVGLGSALGEAVAWGLGRASSEVIRSTVYFNRVNALLELVQKRGSWTIPFLAFVFSLTFLPDKLIYLPLGVMRYSIWRLLPFTILGKVSMVYLVMVFGRLWSTYVEESVGGWLSFILTTAILAVAMFIMIYVDWERVLYKAGKS